MVSLGLGLAATHVRSAHSSAAFIASHSLVFIDLQNAGFLRSTRTGNAVPADGDPIGIAFDQAGTAGQGLAAFIAAQPQLLANHDFASGQSNWAVQNAAPPDHQITFADNAARFQLTTTTPELALVQENATVVGDWYELKVAVRDHISGNLKVDSQNGAVSFAFAQGLNTVLFEAPGTQCRILGGSSNTDITIESAELRRVPLALSQAPADGSRPFFQSGGGALFDGVDDEMGLVKPSGQSWNGGGIWCVVDQGATGIIIDTDSASFGTHMFWSGKKPDNSNPVIFEGVGAPTFYLNGVPQDLASFGGDQLRTALEQPGPHLLYANGIDDAAITELQLGHSSISLSGVLRGFGVAPAMSGPALAAYMSAISNHYGVSS